MPRLVMFLLLASSLLTAASPPNVVLITLDTTRRDALSCYGQTAIRTRALDRIAGVSHQFLNAYAPVPQTLPSHASLLTGLDPFGHGIRDNFSKTLDPSFPTIATLLKGRGYHSAAVIASTVLNHRFGLNQGIDAYDDDIRNVQGIRRADEVTALALGQLERLQAPYFLWIHYYDPHYPYDAPGAKDTSDPYLAEVQYMDRQIGVLMEKIDLQSSMVIIAGDHGEMLGEHGEEEHGVLLYEGAIRVPLLIHLPGQTEHREHKATVSLSAVQATVREVLKLDAPSRGGHPSLFAGEDPPPVYIETFYPYYSFQWSPLRGVVVDSQKLIVSARGQELFRLSDDPGERKNLADEEPALANRLRRTMDGICPEKEFFPPQFKPESIPYDLQKQLESLGYLGGTGQGDRGTPSAENCALPRDVADIAFFITRKAPVLLRQGQERAVLNEAKKALKRDPYNVELINVAGLAYLQLGELNRAKDIFLEGLRLAPSFHKLLASMGRCSYFMKRLDEAETYMQRAIHANAFQPTYYAYLAQIYLDQKKLDLAQATVDAAYREGRMAPGLTFISGMLALSRSEYPEAIRAFEETLKDEPDMFDAIDKLALCYYQMRNYPKAWTTLQAGLEKQPKNFELNKKAFEVALVMNKRVEARSIAVRFVDLFPMTEEARVMRELFPDLP